MRLRLSENAQRLSRVMYYYLKGKALNVGPQHSPQAEAALSKAVKLDPTLVEAWNELGDCYWKKDEIKEAKNCFMGALGHEKDSAAQREPDLHYNKAIVSKNISALFP
uniref:Tetratricopeptide repeat protein n=1 Tax=Timema tahoe TaxID=61484 RepID=A0A7R9IPX2_9NEOP|nr:unnamed protein product [Timema tahoe]